MSIKETGDKILKVANTLFSRFGFQKTSMDEKALEEPFYVQDRYSDYAPHFDGSMGKVTKGLSD